MKKTSTLQLRLTPEIKELLLSRASAYGMTMSEYVRYLVLEDTRKENVTFPHTQASP